MLGSRLLGINILYPTSNIFNMQSSDHIIGIVLCFLPTSDFF